MAQNSYKYLIQVAGSAGFCIEEIAEVNFRFITAGGTHHHVSYKSLVLRFLFCYGSK